MGRGTLREERKRALFNEPCAILRFSGCLPGASTIEVEGGLDIGLRIRGQHVGTGSLEGFGDRCRCLTDEISYSVRKEQLGFRLHVFGVLILESFTVDFGELLSCGGRISSKDEGGLLKQEAADVFELSHSLLDIVGDGQQAEPECDELARVVRVALHKTSLVFDNLTDRGNGIVTSVVVHLQFLFLALDLRCDSEVDTAFQRLKAQVRVVSKSFSCILRDNADTVGRGLTKAS